MGEPAIDTRHWPGTTGATDVLTSSLTELALALEAVLSSAKIVAVDGAVGVGKSFAIKLLLGRIGVPWWYLPIGPDPTGKSFEVAVLQAIYDRRFKRELPRRRVDRHTHRDDLRYEIHKVFRAPGILVIDDFTKSGLVGVDAIRWLCEQPENRVGFVLLGNDVDRLLQTDQALYSRIIRVVPFDPIPDGAVATTIKPYHPLFAAADLRLLERINRDHCAGSFRAWAIFLATVLDLLGRLGESELTGAIADRAIAQINKRPGRHGLEDGPR